MERAQYNCKERVGRGRRVEIPQNQADVDIIYIRRFSNDVQCRRRMGGEFSIESMGMRGVRNGSSVARAIAIEGTPHPLPLSLSPERKNKYI